MVVKLASYSLCGDKNKDKMYRAVPPPDKIAEDLVTTRDNPPANVKLDQWQKFQDLKLRRTQISGAEGRVKQCKKKILDKVSRELDIRDKLVLAEEGVRLPEPTKKKDRADYGDTELAGSSGKRARRVTCGHCSCGPCSSATGWSEVKNFLAPNPQLRGWRGEGPVVKSGLERELEEAVDQGDLERAVGLSDMVSSREMACKVATAFDCIDYAKRHKVEEDKKKSKPAKLKWMFDKKHRWESKGNM